MIVCGLPGAGIARPPPSWSCGDSRKALTTRLTSWKAATDVAPAAASTIRNAPRRMRFQRPPPLGNSSGNAQVLVGDLLLADQVYELHKGRTVAGHRRYQSPFPRAVVARALGAELHRRHASLDETDRVGRAVAAHRDALRGRALRHRGRQQLHIWVAALHDRGRSGEHLGHVHVRDRAHALEDALRILA